MEFRIYNFAVSIYWEDPPGNRLNDLHFEPGESMHLSVQIRGVFGLPEPGLRVETEIRKTSGDDFTPLYMEGITNVAGNIDWDFTLPYVSAKARAQFLIHGIVETGPQEIIVNIGIGEDPNPPPSSDSLPLILLGAGGLVLAYFLIKKGGK